MGSKVPVLPWAPHELIAVLRGHMTLGELAGISKPRQLEMAKMGRQLMRDGLNGKAREVFLGLEALDPYDAYVQTCLGVLALAERDWRDSERRFTRALELNPESVPALAYRGELRLQHLDAVEEGVADLTSAVEKDPHRKYEGSLRARAILAALRGA